MRYTVDASVLVKLIVEEENSANALKLISMSAEKDLLYAPDIIYYEVGSVLYKMCKRNVIEQGYAAQAYAMLLQLPLETTSYMRSKILPDILAMSVKLGMHFYDCLYIHTAKLTGSTLVTSDQKLQNAARHECKVISLASI